MDFDDDLEWHNMFISLFPFKFLVLFCIKSYSDFSSRVSLPYPTSHGRKHALAFQLFVDCLRRDCAPSSCSRFPNKYVFFLFGTSYTLYFSLDIEVFFLVTELEWEAMQRFARNLIQVAYEKKFAEMVGQIAIMLSSFLFTCIVNI